MAGFFDKMTEVAKSAATATGEIAKTAAEKGQVMVETTKINNKIKEEENQIAGAKKAIGDVIFQRFLAGDGLDGQLGDLCEEISKRIAAIESFEAEIDKIRNNA